MTSVGVKTKLDQAVLDLPQVLAEYAIGGSSFKIYGSKIKTYEKAAQQLYDRRTLILSYHFLTDDTRTADLPLNACREVVLGEIQKMWYEVMGREIPDSVIHQQELRMAKAKASTAAQEGEETATKTKEPRVTNKSIIEQGLLAGKSDQEIMADVKARFPDGKADSKHIGYYRHFLIKNGQLPESARPPRARKAKAEGGEEAQAKEPVKVQAKAGQAKSKAAPARPAKAKAGR